MSGVRVAHLSTAHSPYDIRIYHRECRTLAGAGYDTVVIAPHEHDDALGDVRVHGVPAPRGRGDRMTRTAWLVLRAVLRERAQICHFHDPELIWVGLVLRLCGRQVIYDVHEDLPRQMMAKHWIPGWLRRTIAVLAALVEGLAARLCSGIVAATPSIGRRFPVGKTVVVQNFPPAPTSGPPPARTATEPLLLYIGSGITVPRGAREMVDAMALLPADHLAAQARLLLAGRFEPPELEAELRQHPGWARTHFAGWLSRAEVEHTLQAGTVGLVVEHPVPNHLESYPIKLFEYMAAGIPVVTSDFPLWRSIVASAECGLLVDPLDPRAIAGAIEYLLAHPDEAAAMGRRGADAVRREYHWEGQARKLLDFYAALCNKRG